MKLYDRNKILVGIAIFVAVFTFPLWYNLGKAAQAPDPSLDTPAINKLKARGEAACVESREFMRANHMHLLEKWRNAVVRKGDRMYVGQDARRWEMSLSKTCMECHSNKAQFCDQCHDYASVTPYCWDCHVEPPTGPQAAVGHASQNASKEGE